MIEVPKETKSGMMQLLSHVEPEHHEWVRRRAFEEKTTMSDIVRKLICADMMPKSEKTNAIVDEGMSRGVK